MLNQYQMDPVGEMGRGVMKATGNMSPEQKAAYAQQNQMMGVAPQQELELMMAQQQQLRNFKPQQPPMPTVRDKLAQAAAQMQQGIGSIPTGVMNNASYAGGGIVAFQDGGSTNQMAEGILASQGAIPSLSFLFGNRDTTPPLAKALTNVPNEALLNRYAEAVTSGDSKAQDQLEVVLRSRGLKRDIDNIKNAAVKVQRDMEIAATAQSLGFSTAKPPAAPAKPPAAAPSAVQRPAPAADTSPSRQVAAPKKESKTTEDYYEERRKFREKEGIGKAAQDYTKFLTEQEQKLDKEFGEDKRMAFAQIGFRMAQAASRPGATFLGAMAEGAMTGAEAMTALKKEYRRTQLQLRQAQLDLTRSQEMEKMGDYDKASAIRADAENRAADLWYKSEALKNDAAKIQATNMNTSAQLEANAAYRDEAMNQRRVEQRNKILGDDLQYMNARAKLNSAVEAGDDKAAAAYQAKLRAIEADADRRVGIAAAPAAGPADTGLNAPIQTRFRYDPSKGLVPVE
jgi:hypothetical protein